MKRTYNFNTDWEYLFLFCQNNTSQAECLVCGKVMNLLTKYNIERHYKNFHESIYGSMNETDRKNSIVQLKMAFNEKQATLLEKESVLQSVNIDSIVDIKAKLKTSDFLYKSLQTIVKKCIFFSIALDEITDVSDISQLMICIKTIDENFNSHEEMLSFIPLHGNTTGLIIYESIFAALNKIGGYEKLSAVCTDGSPAMVENRQGFVGQLHTNNINIPAYHCIIHQQALLSKCANIDEAMTYSIKIINKIRGCHNSLGHRKFVRFLAEIDAEYGDLSLFTEVGWLCKEKFLNQFFSLRNEVVTFLESSDQLRQYAQKLKDPSFLLDLAFLCDITKYLNELNLCIQRRHKNIFDLISTIKSFKRKLISLRQSLTVSNLEFFGNLNEVVQEHNIHDFQKFVPVFDLIINSFDTRFKDFDEIESYAPLFQMPLVCDVNSQKEDLREELAMLQSDLSVPLETGLEFWKKLDGHKYVKLKLSIAKLMSMFGSTYICECFRSKLEIITSKYRNQLSDGVLEALMRINTTSLQVCHKY